MTANELEEYNKLSQEAKDMYNMGMKHNPEWTHQQALTYAIVTTGFKPPKEKTSWEEIKELFMVTVKQADHYMETNFPSIYPQVRDTFKGVYNRISTAVSITWNEIVNFFKNL